jgi:uncharacterized membrane protein required for colicin V production
MEVLAEYLVRIAVSVLRRWSRWSLLTSVSVLLVPHLIIQVWVRCLMGDSLRRIRGYRVVRFQGMVF